MASAVNCPYDTLRRSLQAEVDSHAILLPPTNSATGGLIALADEYIDVCKKLYSRHVEKEMIHAGLECGIIKTRVDGLDCISCGPIMKNLHSPDETMNIASFGKYAFAVCTLIANSK